MSPLFRKLNLGSHATVTVLEAPPSFEAELAQLEGVEVRRAATARDRIAFGIAFAVTQAALDTVSTTLTKAADADAVIWIAYPKGTSKAYRCEFNRDRGWAVLEAAGFETVRQVAIDADWTALRFRRSSFVKRAAGPG